MSHYETLGIDSSATPDEIKEAYRRLAKKHHPDKGGDTETFQRIKAAYEALIGEPEPDNERAKLLARVSGLFMAALESCPEPASYDIISHLKRALRGVKKDLDANIAQTKLAIRKREAILKRLRSKQPDSFLHKLLEHDIARHKRSIEELEAEKPKVDATIAFLDDYDYEMSSEPEETLRGLGQMRYLGFNELP